MEDNSPYQASKVAPTAQRSSRVDWRDEPPREITSPIKHMWILLAVLGSFSVIGAVGVLFMRGGAFNAVLLAPMLILACVYLLLAFGVYKRSRIVATLVLSFCGLAVLGTVVNIVTGQGSLVGIGFMAIFTFVSVRGTLATYRYHRHMANVRTRPARARLSDDPAFAPKLDA
ncbi:hypothetical protein [Stenotrophomonas oahuensis]|uniref:Transmembrane protein n=1 Tax=Stenotrophomonas oahuensis TaxID=3003271 RepID=A0ABY9YK92_9GAMM|nr:hypothetical protein [Stenotrophomonas sp. A5586]WNH51304.1 hypothetical protein PDM29_13120 [Stenotrophomonas sp. A5586]